ncbi:hypothetical protein GJ744_005247 [Endocarpon pusillum]|uniref:DUF1275 domain protein n=1 Tax=Endocarpon pusillum TaxID=364733 RepID=A0A8H7DZP4_9EURO|nr:hypothetical protein GJ744_005247 [Endocarpon pusillum]
MAQSEASGSPPSSLQPPTRPRSPPPLHNARNPSVVSTSSSPTLIISPFDSPLHSQSSSVINEKEDHQNRMTSSIRSASRFMEHFNEEVAGAHTSLYLLASFFTSGLIDSVAFNAWSCFVGMQTGNTIFAALGFSGQPLSVHPNAYLKSITSISSFCAGTLFFSAMHRIPCWFDPNPAPSRRRFILIVSFTIQTTFIVVVALLIQLGFVSSRASVSGAFSSGNHLSDLPNPEEEDNYKDLIAIALLAFQSAGPVFFSRVLGIIEMPTIVLSTLYCDFVADLYHLPASLRNKKSWYSFFFNDERRQFRRLGSILMLFLGGLTGGFMFRSVVGMVGAIWLASGLKGNNSFSGLEQNHTEQNHTKHLEHEYFYRTPKQSLLNPANLVSPRIRFLLCRGNLLSVHLAYSGSTATYSRLRLWGSDNRSLHEAVSHDLLTRLMGSFAWASYWSYGSITRIDGLYP